MSLRVIFMGTPEFAVPTLEALIGSQHEVIAVYSQPPRPSGRGHKVQKSPVHLAAEQHSIPVHTPKSLRDAGEQATFTHLKPDVAVVAAYGLILPNPILDAPAYGCLNVHASLLPRWRGAAPIQRAILAGDDETGITIMQIAEQLDSGPIYSQATTPITGKATVTDLHDTLAALGARMMVQTLNNITQLSPTPQPEASITYAKKLTKAESKIDWTQSAEQLHRQVRALNPWPGLWFKCDNMRVKLLAAKVIKMQHDRPAGTMTDNDFTVACGTNALQLQKVQPEGRKPMSGQDFINGYKISTGKCFT